jgi:GTP pyrophosphokinase
LGRVASDFSFQGVDDLIAAIGYGKLTVNQILGKLVPQEKLEQKEGLLRDEGKGVLKGFFEKITHRSRDALLIKGIDNVMVRFAGCCNPLPGDKVVGFITRGRGVTVHTEDCRNTLDSDPNRRVDVEWDANKEYSYPVRIRVYSDDKKGILAEISSSISANEANITNARIDTTDEKKAIGVFEVEIRDLNHLKKIIRDLEKLKGVNRVERVRE